MKIQRKTDTLIHHGISGQKHGVRRYQKLNGTYTKEGNERYRGKNKEDTQDRLSSNPEKPEKPSKSSSNTSALKTYKQNVIETYQPVINAVVKVASTIKTTASKIGSLISKGAKAVAKIGEKMNSARMNQITGMSEAGKSFIEVNKSGLKKTFKKNE